MLACSIELPPAFRPGDILAFHRRDPLAGSEHVDASSLLKGLVWDGLPAGLSIEFGVDRAEAVLVVDGALTAGAAGRFEALVWRMLGLNQPVEAFEARFRDHPRLGRLLDRQRGLRVPVAATPFEALSWAITGQQISVGAALSLRRKLIQAVGLRHSSGLYCYPGAAEVAALSGEALRQAGFSAGKARTLLAVAEGVAAGELPLDAWTEDCPAAEIGERLLAVRGIGPWTVSYTLLRGFGWLDGSLHGDVAVRRGLQQLLGREAPVGEPEAKAWLAPFSPWRALVAAHLWALKSAASY